MVGIKADNSCYGCTERTVGCHSICEKYINWKNDKNSANARRRKHINEWKAGYYHDCK